MMYLMLRHLLDISYPQGVQGVFRQGDMILSLNRSALDIPLIRVMLIPYLRRLQHLIPLCTQVSYPQITEEALQNPKWLGAMKDEIETLKKNNIWENCMLPKRKKQQAVNGFFRSSIMLIGSLRDTKLVLQPRGIPRHTRWIIDKPSLQLSRLI